MSKRHTSSRRKTYGRRQHEVRERNDRGQHTEGFEFELGEWGSAGPGRPARVPRSAQSAHPLRARRLIDGRLRGRPPSHHRAAARGRGSPRARPSNAAGSVAPSAPAAGRTGSASSSGPSSSRSCSRSSRSPSRSASRRPGSTSAGSSSSASASTTRRPSSAPTSTGSAASRPIRKQAIDAGLGQLSEPLVLPAALDDRATDAGPYRFAPPAPRSCSSSSCVGVVRARSPGWRTGRSSTASGWPREALAQTTVTLDDAEQARRHLRPDGTVVLATTVQRERLVAAPDQLTPDQRAADRRRAGRGSSGSTRPTAIALRDKLTGDAKYLILAPRARPRRRRPDPGRASRPSASSACRSSPSPSGSTRRSAAARARRLAAHLLGFVNREGGGQYGVEQAYQSTLAGEPRVVVAAARRERPADPRRGDRRRSRACPARTCA